MQLLKRLRKSFAATAGNQRGMFTLVELLVVMVIAVVLFTAVSEVTYHTARLVTLSAQDNVSETGARNVVMRIAEDILSADKLWSGSDDKTIYMTKHNKNMDAYSVPNTGDGLSDVACYRWVAPSGADPSVAGYMPGYVSAGTDMGDSICQPGDMSQITDPVTDVQFMEFSYCRPTPGSSTPGTFTCTNGVSGAAYTGDDQCVWQVRVNIIAQRTFNQMKDGQGPKDFNMTTSIMPRNIHMNAIRTDTNKNEIVDCCDAAFVGADATWCPAVQ